MSPAHIKGLYRRGMAYMTAGDFEEARKDFEMVEIFILDLASKLYCRPFLKSSACYHIR